MHDIVPLLVHLWKLLQFSHSMNFSSTSRFISCALILLCFKIFMISTSWASMPYHLWLWSPNVRSFEGWVQWVLFPQILESTGLVQGPKKWFAKHIYEGPRQGQAEQSRNSKREFHQTTYEPFFRPLYIRGGIGEVSHFFPLSVLEGTCMTKYVLETCKTHGKGKCVFPWTYEGKELNGCLNNINNHYYCPVELDNDRADNLTSSRVEHDMWRGIKLHTFCTGFGDPNNISGNSRLRRKIVFLKFLHSTVSLQPRITIYIFLFLRVQIVKQHVSFLRHMGYSTLQSSRQSTPTQVYWKHGEMQQFMPEAFGMET